MSAFSMKIAYRAGSDIGCRGAALVFDRFSNDGWPVMSQDPGLGPVAVTSNGGGAHEGGTGAISSSGANAGDLAYAMVHPQWFRDKIGSHYFGSDFNVRV